MKHLHIISTLVFSAVLQSILSLSVIASSYSAHEPISFDPQKSEWKLLRLQAGATKQELCQARHAICITVCNKEINKHNKSIKIKG